MPDFDAAGFDTSGFEVPGFEVSGFDETTGAGVARLRLEQPDTNTVNAIERVNDLMKYCGLQVFKIDFFSTTWAGLTNDSVLFYTGRSKFNNLIIICCC